jgi:hypothetical protein
LSGGFSFFFSPFSFLQYLQHRPSPTRKMECYITHEIFPAPTDTHWFSPSDADLSPRLDRVEMIGWVPWNWIRCFVSFACYVVRHPVARATRRTKANAGPGVSKVH